ncbi:MATE family efflux transporter [Gracilibacillus alcaliphilus]|uniref:MATE family efflux transporter n=1 Tax=Gracilibacillus alcaliphilus TaxID=1401441 RepID=UPI00195627FD|nr:MATE family efflux transporter [Gracilibacillus alcaliphilus]
MFQTKTLQEKIRLFMIILIPILITQVCMYLMNFFDTIMSGQASSVDLAGVAIGSSLFVPVQMTMVGIMMAMSPIVAQLTGAQQQDKIKTTVQQGIYLAVALGLIITVIGAFLLDPVLSLMDLESEVAHIAKYYIIFMGLGMVPLFIYNLLRSYVDGLGHTRISMFIILISLPINIILNYLFIFGKFGFPALGGIGAGVASGLTFFINAFIAIYIVHYVRPFREHKILHQLQKPDFKQWFIHLKLGVPIGFSIFFEVSIFSAVTMMLSSYSTNTIAAHQAAMNFASLLYMIPLSIAMALTITVGFELGASRIKDARIYSYMGIVSGIAIAIIAGGLIYLLDNQVASLYSTDPEVLALTKQFLYYAIFFQFADAVGAPVQGILRGYKDVNVTFWMSLVSYWLIGLPSGWLLANYTALDAFGYWLGLIIGLSAGAITLFGRMYYMQWQLSRQLG